MRILLDMKMKKLTMQAAEPPEPGDHMERINL
jgi:hypothetical protein